MVRFAYIGKERDKRNLRLLTTFGHDTAAQERWTILTVSAHPFPSPGGLRDPQTNPGLLRCRQVLCSLSHREVQELG